jgi:hypothetical protein
MPITNFLSMGKNTSTVPIKNNINTKKFKTLKHLQGFAKIRNNTFRKINEIGHQQLRENPGNEAEIKKRVAHFKLEWEKEVDKVVKNLNEKIDILTTQLSGKYYRDPPKIINNYIPKGGRIHNKRKNKTRKSKKY